MVISGCKTVSGDANDDVKIENITEQTSFEKNPALYHLQTMAKSSVYGDVCDYDAYERYFLDDKEYTLRQALFRNFELKDNKKKTLLFADVFSKLKIYYKKHTSKQECNDWKNMINANRSMRDVSIEASGNKTK